MERISVSAGSTHSSSGEEILEEKVTCSSFHEREMKTVYGPVPSWRLGKSLGIDVISVGKICSFDCLYCQLGAKDKVTVRRAKFVEPSEIQTDLSDALAALTKGDLDVITFSGMGEPTLASNLGDVRW